MKRTDTLASVSCHLPILISLMKSVIPQRGRGLWKSDRSLLHNAKFIEEMKNHIVASLKNFDKETN